MSNSAPASDAPLQTAAPSGSHALDRRTRLLTGPILPTLLNLTLPVIAVVATQTFVAVLEAFWVSRLGTAAVAGVSLVIPLYILMNTMSGGGIGGGASSAISRAIGGGRAADADALLFHSLLIALAFGALFTGGWFLFGRKIITALGGAGEAESDALTYAGWVFGGAPLIWAVNLAGAAMRGAGEVKLPAIVNLIGAVVLIPLSPALIFGLGPLPSLGVGGAGAATLIYYAGALLVYARHLSLGRGGIRLAPNALSIRHFRDILGVGLLSAVGSTAASLTVVGLTGAVGRFGAQALAGYGIASRVDSLLVPLLFGLGSGVVTLVGVATGAADHKRAHAVTRLSSTIAFLFSEGVGLLVALVPSLWMGLFSHDPQVLADGASYFRIAAPFYGFSGAGIMLYFASQGRRSMLWPFIATFTRLIAAVGGAWWLAGYGVSLNEVFACASVGSVLFGTINFIGLLVGRSRSTRKAAVAARS
jgi:putative MATE family efflux protein